MADDADPETVRLVDVGRQNVEESVELIGSKRPGLIAVVFSCGEATALRYLLHAQRDLSGMLVRFEQWAQVERNLTRFDDRLVARRLRQNRTGAGTREGCRWLLGHPFDFNSQNRGACKRPAP